MDLVVHSLLLFVLNKGNLYSINELNMIAHMLGNVFSWPCQKLKCTERTQVRSPSCRARSFWSLRGNQVYPQHIQPPCVYRQPRRDNMTQRRDGHVSPSPGVHECSHSRPWYHNRIRSGRNPIGRKSIPCYLDEHLCKIKWVDCCEIHSTKIRNEYWNSGKSPEGTGLD